MAIAVLNVGTPAQLVFTTVQTLTWQLSPTPQVGSDLIIAFAFINVGALSANTPTCTDTDGNTYTLIVQQPNLSGDGTQGALNSVIFRAKNINVVGTINVSITTSAGRQSCVANHIEVMGLDQSSNSDRVGGFSSGASTVVSETVIASAPNTFASDLVVCVSSCYNKLNTNQPLPDPPTSNYITPTIMVGANTANAAVTLVQPYEAAYKITSGIETSSATWAMTTTAPVASAAIATFKGIAQASNTAAFWFG